jgi:hypothetical protein
MPTLLLGTVNSIHNIQSTATIQQQDQHFHPQLQQRQSINTNCCKLQESIQE